MIGANYAKKSREQNGHVTRQVERLMSTVADSLAPRGDARRR
jgi:hypothetical protein